MRAYTGHVWLAMGCESWDDWCETELGGFRPQAALRREIVAELAERRITNRSIAEAVGADERTVRRDLATAANAAVDPDRKTLGKDGVWRKPPKKREPKPEPKPVEVEPEPPLDVDEADVSFEYELVDNPIRLQPLDTSALYANVGKLIRNQFNNDALAYATPEQRAEIVAAMQEVINKIEEMETTK